MCRYFDNRMIKKKWFLDVTNGNLKTTPETKFNFFSSSLVTMDAAELDRKLFEAEDENDDKKRLPL